MSKKFNLPPGHLIYLMPRMSKIVTRVQAAPVMHLVPPGAPSWHPISFETFCNWCHPSSIIFASFDALWQVQVTNHSFIILASVVGLHPVTLWALAYIASTLPYISPNLPVCLLLCTYASLPPHKSDLILLTLLPPPLLFSNPALNMTWTSESITLCFLSPSCCPLTIQHIGSALSSSNLLPRTSLNLFHLLSAFLHISLLSSRLLLVLCNC